MSRRASRNASTALAFAAAGVALSVAAAPRIVHAQQTGFALDRYEPNPAGDIFFASDFPRRLRFPLALGVVADYARAPLVARAEEGGPPTREIIDNMFVLHAQATLNLFDRVDISASVPFSLVQTGEPAAAANGNVAPDLAAWTGMDTGGFLSGSGMVTGDIRAGLRVRIAGEADHDPVALYVGGYAYLGFIPYNGRWNNVSDEGFRARGYLTLAGHPGPVRYSVSVGFHYRPELTIDETLWVGPELYSNAAIGLATVDGRLTVGPEAWVYLGGITRPGGHPLDVSSEVLLGVHYLIGDYVMLSAGAGPGLTQGAGTPEIRGLLRLAVAPERLRPAPPAPPPDSDHDGVLDADDACRFEPAGPHPDPARPGCPRRDTDHDGVFDDTDQCVNTPAGDHPDAHRPGCPVPDSDHDGVLNHADQCRTEPQGIHPDPARPGCPAPDRDHDGVIDSQDHCPDQPGAPSPDPNRNGCPGLVRIEQGQIRILSPVFFATNRDTVLSRSFPVLQAVADALRASPEIHRVAIEGHTDNVGNAAHNMDLSQRRANSVMAWLISHGIDAGRLEAHGYGDTHSLVPNTTREGRATNRRVEFHITDPAQPAQGAPSSDAGGATSAPTSTTAPASSGPVNATPTTSHPVNATPTATGAGTMVEVHHPTTAAPAEGAAPAHHHHHHHGAANPAPAAGGATH